jgi:hypothetical protein
MESSHGLNLLNLYCHLWRPLYKGFGAFEIPDMNLVRMKEKQNALFSENERNQKI